jgi:hypothetical protein
MRLDLRSFVLRAPAEHGTSDLHVFFESSPYATSSGVTRIHRSSIRRTLSHHHRSNERMPGQRVLEQPGENASSTTESKEARDALLLVVLLERYLVPHCRWRGNVRNRHGGAETKGWAGRGRECFGGDLSERCELEAADGRSARAGRVERSPSDWVKQGPVHSQFMHRQTA